MANGLGCVPVVIIGRVVCHGPGPFQAGIGEDPHDRVGHELFRDVVRPGVTCHLWSHGSNFYSADDHRLSLPENHEAQVATEQDDSPSQQAR